MSNPLDDYLSERPITKKAFGLMGPGFGHSVAQGMREGATQALGQGAVGLAATGLGVAAMKTYRALRKRRDFKEMLSVNPDLAEYQEQDPMRFNAHYNSLRSMNPGYAEDPVIAGSLMRSMSMNPNTAGGVLMQSLESSSKALGGNQRQFSLGSKMTDKGQETSSSYRF